MERLTTSYSIGQAGAMVRISEDRSAPSTFTVTVDDGDPLTPFITAVYEVRDGDPQCRELRITSTDDGREVRAGDGRKLRVEDWMEEALASTAMPLLRPKKGEPGDTGSRVANPDGRGFTTWVAPDNSDAAETVRQVRVIRRNARRSVTDELLQEVAEVYRANVEDGPTAAVAARFGKAHRTAALYVKQARAAGFLGAAITGRAGER